MGRDHVYGVALLSNAMHQSGYAPGLARHPRLRVLVLADDPGQEPLVVQRNRDLADELGVPYIEDVDAALRWPGVEVLSVCPQIERRGDLVRRAAASGKHLWLDKPLAPTVADCTVIVDMLRLTGQKTSIVSHLGYDHIQQARRWIAQGRIGDILAIHADVHFAKGQPDRTDNPPAPPAPLGRWTYRTPDGISDPTESGHSVIAKRELYEIGYYAVVYIRYLSGLPVEGVFARAGSHFFEAHAERGVEDFATIELTLAGGAIATITTGRIGRASHPMNGANHLTIIGAQGTLLLDLRRQTAELCSGVSGQQGPTIISRDDSSDALVNHFVRVLDGDEPAWADVEAGRAHVATLLAGYESVAMGTVVRPEFG